MVAQERLRQNVLKRIDYGWRLDTIARRLGLRMADVQWYASPASARTIEKTFDGTPRLVKR